MRLTATPIPTPQHHEDRSTGTLLKPCDHRGRGITLQDFELNIFIVG